MPRTHVSVFVWKRISRGFRFRWCHTSHISSMTHAQWGMLSHFHGFSVLSGDGRKRFKYATCGCLFYLKTKTYLLFQKYLDTGPYSTRNNLNEWVLGDESPHGIGVFPYHWLKSIVRFNLWPRTRGDRYDIITIWNQIFNHQNHDNILTGKLMYFKPVVS